MENIIDKHASQLGPDSICDLLHFALQTNKTISRHLSSLKHLLDSPE